MRARGVRVREGGGRGGKIKGERVVEEAEGREGEGEREALLFDPGPIARVSGPPRSVGVTQVATLIRLMGTNIIIAASSSLGIQID